MTNANCRPTVRYKPLSRPLGVLRKAAIVIGVATIALPVGAWAAEDRFALQSPRQAQSGDRTVGPTASLSSRNLTPLSRDRAIVTTYTFDLNGQDVTTVYLQGLPIVTLRQQNTAAPAARSAIAREADALSRSDRSTAADNAADSVVDRVGELVIHLRRLQQQSINADEITVSQDKGTVTLSIQNLPVIEYNEQVVNHPGHDLAGTVLMAVNRLRRTLAAAPPLASLPGMSTALTTSSTPTLTPRGDVFAGVASWYGPGFAGRLAANGEVYNPENLTAAHKTLPFGTVVEVTNPSNGRSVVVEITDRGPYIAGRTIDLSTAAARTIGLIQSGVGPVQMRIISP